MGTVYLIHLAQPMGEAQDDAKRAAYGLPPRKGKHFQSQHYIGYTTRSLKDRLTEHQNGAGARFMAVATQRGIEWKKVRTWKGTRATERRLKKMHNARLLCPVCNPTGWKNRAKFTGGQ